MKDSQELKMEVEFTQSQKSAIPKLSQWLKVPIDLKDISTRVFRFTGQAGTGKTFLIQYILKELIEEDLGNKKALNSFAFSGSMFGYPNVVGVAMSHKAKKVLQGSIPICKTYASYFGLQVKYLNDGSIVFYYDGNKKGHLYCDLPIKVAVHDECGMYNQEMLDVTLKRTSPYTKIIFMGDPGQLPPISSKHDNLLPDQDSPVFRLDLPESSSHHLVERVRQTEGNPIIEMSDVIYREIFGGQNIKKVLNAFRDEKFSNGIGYKTIFYNQFLEYFKNSSENFLDTKLIAYRNNTVETWNDSIRDYLYSDEAEVFVKNEIIYMNDTFVQEPLGERTVKGTKWVCYNSDEYILTNTGYETTQGIDCHLLYIDKTGHDNLKRAEEPFVRVVTAKGFHPYQKKKAYLYQKAINCPQDTKDNRKLRSMHFQSYYAFVRSFGNVSYGYCFTGYKAQGSTYKNVFVDVNDILTTGPISDKRKLQALYTAVTRASHQVVFIKSR